jgi:hypothetical protein
MKMYLPPRGAPDNRRGFLKKGLFGGLLLALGGGGFLFTRRGASVAMPGGLQVLNASEYAVMWAIVQRFNPAREGFPAADTLNTAVAADGIIALLEPVTQEEIKQLLMLFENALPNFLFGGRAVPFTQLNPVEQEEVLGEWRDSRLTLRRTGYRALRGIAVAAYYGNQATWSAVGYPGPPPGIHDPTAAVWKGGETPRPIGNGTMLERPEPESAPAPAPVPAPAVDGGVP